MSTTVLIGSEPRLRLASRCMSFVQSLGTIKYGWAIRVAREVSKDNKNKPILDKVAGAGTSDKLAGKTKEAVGNAKQAVGKATDNPKLKAEGVSEEIEGKQQKVLGGIKEVAENVADAVAEGVECVKDAMKNAQKRND